MLLLRFLLLHTPNIGILAIVLHSWPEWLLILPRLILLKIFLLLAILGHEVIVDASVYLGVLRDVHIIHHLLSLYIIKNRYRLLVLIENVRDVLHVLLRWS